MRQSLNITHKEETIVISAGRAARMEFVSVGCGGDIGRLSGQTCSSGCSGHVQTELCREDTGDKVGIAFGIKDG